MWLMLASASPRKPYVPIVVRSSKALSLDVVNRSHKIGRSSLCPNVSYCIAIIEAPTDVNSMSIVCDLEKFEPAILDQDLY